MRTLALALALSTVLLAQSSQLGGRITDPSGQAIPAASITLTNQATKVRREATTSAEGLYSIPALTPGTYSVKVTKDGFKSLDRTGIILTVDTRSRVDAQLEVGSVSESVNVTENIGALQVESPEISTTITQGQVQNLPLVQLGRVRVAAAFIYLTAGVQGNVRIDGADNLAASNQIRVHGSGTFQHEFWVDGLPAGQMGTIGNFNESAPPVEAMREFKLQTSQLAAEFGHTGQAVTSFALKSGTNQLHGSAFEYFRNDKLDARSWFASDRAITRQNEFGLTVGGPIWIPKVYDGRNKSFFFFSWTSARRRGLDNRPGPHRPQHPGRLRRLAQRLRQPHPRLRPRHHPSQPYRRLHPRGLPQQPHPRQSHRSSICKNRRPLPAPQRHRHSQPRLVHRRKTTRSRHLHRSRRSLPHHQSESLLLLQFHLRSALPRRQSPARSPHLRHHPGHLKQDAPPRLRHHHSPQSPQ
ncbi:MAG: carboxypeptidase-like regulatory domain-containing protein [Acidobacteria bacterium]|nr:carboxypeptidase-like regulatory domain-containing protein [Acidobacteriota bacterium]